MATAARSTHHSVVFGSQLLCTYQSSTTVQVVIAMLSGTSHKQGRAKKRHEKISIQKETNPNATTVELELSSKLLHNVHHIH